MKPHLTVAEFCDHFRVGRSTFYRERNAGRIPVLKIGRATRIKSTDAEAWAATLVQAIGGRQ